MNGSDMLVVPALGRPFKLGSMYDRRKDELLPSMSLWSPERLHKDSTLTSQKNCMFEVLTGTTFKDASKAFEMDPAMTLSFLCDLVEISGSANYLKEKTTSDQCSRVSLKYYCTSKYEEADMKHLDPANIQYKDMMEQNLATHVVIAILYGAQAVFLFESQQKLQESPKAFKNRISQLVSNTAKAQLKADEAALFRMSEQDRELSEKIYCKYYGDIELKQNPVTFEEAMNAYKHLPSLYTDERAVPLKVWLFPLSRLAARMHSSANIICKTIGADLVRQLESILEGFSNVLADAEAFKKRKACERFQALKKDVGDFLRLATNHKAVFKSQLKPLIVAIRKGEKSDDDLYQAIRTLERSPYNLDKLQTWIQTQMTDMDLLDGYLEPLSIPKILNTSNKGQLEQVITDNDEVVCLKIRIGHMDDKQVGEMKTFSGEWGLKRSESNDSLMSMIPEGVPDEEVYVLDDFTTKRLRLGVAQFKGFMSANVKRESIRFVVYTKNNPSKATHLSISIYKRGKCIHENFHPPSEPRSLMPANVDRGSITLKWDEPTTGPGMIKSYRILWRKGKDKEWQHKHTEDNTTSHKFTDLQSGTTYAFKLAGNCVVGRTHDSRQLEVTTPVFKIPMFGQIRGRQRRPEEAANYEESHMVHLNSDDIN